MPRPAKINNVLSELFLRRGYARALAQDELHTIWCAIVGDNVARQTRVGAIKRGVLEVTVASSLLVQELNYQKPSIVDRLRAQLPQESIRDLRCRVGSVQRRGGEA